MANNVKAELLRAQFKMAHEWLEGTMQGVTEEVAHWHPPGKAHPIGGEYVHVAVAEDYLLSVIVRGTQPLIATAFADNGGFSEAIPSGGWSEWARRVRVDVAQSAAYAHAVYAQTEAYLTSVGDDEINREVDASAVGFGKVPVGAFLSILIANVFVHTGEISCLKGLQGLQGYPF